MEKTIKFSKDHSAAIKGVAVLFLLCYHCFSSESRLYGAEVSFWPFDKAIAMSVLNVMSICVGMFAFITVYGLTISLKKQFENYQFTSHEAVLWGIKRYLSIFFMFLIPFVFCLIVTLATHTLRYDGSTAFKIATGLMDFLGLGHIFGTRMMVSTWWYVSLLVLITLLMPLAVRIYQRYSWLMIPMILLPGSFMLEKGVHLTMYLFVVPLAVCFADQNVLARLKAYQLFSSKWLSKLVKFIFLTSAVVLLWKIYDSSWGLKYFEFFLKGFFPLVMILWCYEFLIDIPIIKQILIFLGNRSADIFYIHTFIRALWLKDFTYSLGHIGWILLFVLGLSVVISLFLDGLKKLIRYKKITGYVTEKIINWADKTL